MRPTEISARVPVASSFAWLVFGVFLCWVVYVIWTTRNANRARRQWLQEVRARYAAPTPLSVPVTFCDIQARRRRNTPK